MKCGECGNTLPPCDGFPRQVFCKRFHLHMGIYEDASRCRDFEKKPQTNADRIRSMSDEELAEFIVAGLYDICPHNCFEDLDRPCKVCSLDWLKQETET